MKTDIFRIVGYLFLLTATALTGFLCLFRSWFFLPLFILSLVAFVWASRQSIVVEPDDNKD